MGKSSSMSEMSDGRQKTTSFHEHFVTLSQQILQSLIKISSPSLVFTLQFRAAVSAAVVLTVGGTVHHLWDADQKLAVVPEDHHGQFAPALLHQVLGFQQG